MNAYDSWRLATLLEKNGWQAAESRSQADFVFLNTCSIREKAALKVLAHLRELAPLKKQNPSLIVGVGGCVAEQEGIALYDKAPTVDLVVGPRRLAEIPYLLDSWDKDCSPIILAGDPPQEAVFNPQNVYPLYPQDDKTNSPLSAFITIMEGCNNFCAYCVVPYLRGREVSRPEADILAEAKSLLAKGTREITLLGQNVNSYDPDPGAKASQSGSPFSRLLARVAALEGLWRLRFTTSHPKDLDPSLTRLYGTLPKLMPHIHLPLQAGSDKVLSKMGRSYTKAHYLSLIDALRKSCPQIAITTDIIVGFPGETEEDFQETLAILESIQFDSIFSFKYSDRPNTKANNLPNKLPEEEKSRRLSLIIELQKEISRKLNMALIGSHQEVLVYGHGREPNQLAGRTGNFKIVHFPGQKELIGELVTVSITNSGPVTLKGEIIDALNPTLRKSQRA
jgi:tRNA-2-methylthio-N6-dimethylallyladenosine synthase